MGFRGRGIVFRIAAAAAALFLGSSGVHGGQRGEEESPCLILEKGDATIQAGPRTEILGSPEKLLRFYRDRGCRLAWSEGNMLDPQGGDLADLLSRAEEEGLESENPAYHRESILRLIHAVRSSTSADSSHGRVHLDLLLTDAYLAFADHLYYGLLPREEIPERWTITRKKRLDAPTRLKEALENNTLRESLEELSPPYRGYRALGNMLVKYLRIQEAGGWRVIEESELDAPEVIRERLRIEGDLDEEEGSGEEYREALRRFQKRHGISADGVMGFDTLSKMNIPLEEKIASIRLNMERWRWMPRTPDETYVSVNIPDFSLSLVTNDQTAFRMRAILGREERPTSIFGADMKTIVVNPYWRVPDTILREDILPRLRKNPSYLQKERLRVFRLSDVKGDREVDPRTIDWKKIDPSSFPYYLRQDPGAKNVLGRLKFLFPNPHDTYIHDTPDKHLFERKERIFSSGCIRIEEPLKLARYLLGNDGKEGDDIEALIASGENKTIPLSRPVRVYISYWTAWEDDEGRGHFRDDLYGYDRELSEILERR